MPPTSPTADPALRVLFASPECEPWVKTGGLGDVTGALAAQLHRDGVDVRVLMPAYRSVREHLAAGRRVAANVDAGQPDAALVDATLPGGVPVLLIDCPPLFDRAGGPYADPEGRDWPDNAQRFALLSRTAAALATATSPLAWRPDVLHCHDWQAAAAAAIVAHAGIARARTLVTVHNLAFQGVFDGDLTALLGLPPHAFGIEGIEYFGRTSYLKAGLMFADRLSTVSPTYAREIQQAPLGFGLEGVLARRRDRLTGILNGIDDTVWDPSRDALIAQRYDRDSLELKLRNKTALQQAMGLDVDPRIPLFGVVSRLTTQKGSDLVIAVAERIVGVPAQLVVLGSGDRELERTLLARSAQSPRAMAARIAFDEALAHRIEAGADVFVMPSRFEPCGLNQMYSQRYGTPPIAHATGGLCDSIVDATAAEIDAGRATGFLFDTPSVEALWQAIVRALDMHATPQRWRAIQRAGMAQRFGWRQRARDYVDLYRTLLVEAASV